MTKKSKVWTKKYGIERGSKERGKIYITKNKDKKIKNIMRNMNRGNFRVSKRQTKEMQGFKSWGIS